MGKTKKRFVNIGTKYVDFPIIPIGIIKPLGNQTTIERNQMKTIATAVQKGSSVYVYDDKGGTLFIRSGELQGYTSTTVSIRQGSSVYVYDANGATKFIR